MFKYHLVKVIGSCLAAMLNELIAYNADVNVRGHQECSSLCGQSG